MFEPLVGVWFAGTKEVEEEVSLFFRVAEEGGEDKGGGEGERDGDAQEAENRSVDMTGALVLVTTSDDLETRPKRLEALRAAQQKMIRRLENFININHVPRNLSSNQW